MKKGVFFTIDALLASGIIIISIVLISKFYYSEQQTTNINYASKDIVNVLSSMTVDGANNEYVKNLTASGLITDTNNTRNCKSKADKWLYSKGFAQRNKKQKDKLICLFWRL